ncbi:hypothetical protein BGZ98_004813, partial [Dissophora globulifera]
VKIHRKVQDSPNIVKFFGITQMRNKGDYGMVLQFAGQGSLREYLAQHFHTLSWDSKIKLAHDVSSGIAFIHEDNICHHDLHSRNVLVDHHGRALITDFGLSRYVNQDHSNNGVRGVVPYISPERLRNAPFDHSSDVYSLGVIMWELTSGQPPFNEGENFLLPLLIINGRRETVVPGTPTEYSMLYQMCWDGEPSRRPGLPSILRTLEKLLAERNTMQAEQSGAIQPTSPDQSRRPVSEPTGTVPVILPGPAPNSEPIGYGNIGKDIRPVISKSVASTRPLVPKPVASRLVVSPPQDSDIDTLINDLSGSRISEADSTEHWRGTETPPSLPQISTPPRPAWIYGTAVGGPAGHQQRLGSPKQTANPAVQPGSPGMPGRRLPYPQQQEGGLRTHPSPNPGHIYPVIIPSADEIPEKGMPSMGVYYPPRPTSPSPQQQLNRYTQRVGGQQSMGYSQGSKILYPPTVPGLSSSLHPTGTGSTGSRNSNSNNYIPIDGVSRIRDFFMACRDGQLVAVKWHLDQGANVMEPYQGLSGRTSLHAAAMSQNLEVMMLLCESAGPRLNMNEVDDSLQTPMHLLAHFNRMTSESNDMLIYMLKKGANPNMLDSDRMTPLMRSFILTDNPQMVDTLLDYGADPTIRCQENNALAEAAIRLRYECVKILLDTDLSMTEPASLTHALDVCYRTSESDNRNRVLGLLVRWRSPDGIQRRLTLAHMILNGKMQQERRIDQTALARYIVSSSMR